MLKRSTLTIYMAQKSDTFGKDSEASVALGQGKPVIVYVPRLHIDGVLDSEFLGMKPRNELIALLKNETNDQDIDETIDEQSLLSRLLELSLAKLTEDEVANAVKKHWADFDLYGEAGRVPEDLRPDYRAWLDSVVHGKGDKALTSGVREQVVNVLIATTILFERRARTFKEQHPLALQVILSTGVLNGILVARSVESCAALTRGLVTNEIGTILETDDHNYRLLERETRSTMRVISRHTLIGNAFSAFYKKTVA